MALLIDSTTILDKLPSAVCILNTSDISIKYVNELFSNEIMPRSNAIGLIFSDYFFPNKADRVKLGCVISQFIIDGKPFSQSLDIITTLTFHEFGGFPIMKPIVWNIAQLDEKCVILTGNMMSFNSENSMSEIGDGSYSASDFIDYFQKAPIALHWLSGTGKVIWANEIELKTLGYTKEEYIGKNISEFCPDEPVLLNEVFRKLG